MSKTKEQIVALIKKEVRRGARIMALVGLGTLGLGAFMICLHVFEWDSELKDSTTAMIVALYFFAILFVLVGVGMLYVAIFKNADNGNQFLKVLLEQPEEIAEIYVNCNVGTDPPFRIDLYTQEVPRLGHLSLVVSYRDKKAFQLQMKAAHAGEIVHFCRQHAPHAFQ